MVEVKLTDAARDDLLRLREHLHARHGAPLPGEFAELEDDAALLAVQRGAIRALVEIRGNPWAGVANRARTGSRHIVDGRHLYFDRDGYEGRHPGDKGFRIVYRLVPTDGAPAVATIYAIAERASQRAYKLAEQRWPRAD
jgi:plasmid stabilization system protein ParE